MKRENKTLPFRESIPGGRQYITILALGALLLIRLISSVDVRAVPQVVSCIDLAGCKGYCNDSVWSLPETYTTWVTGKGNVIMKYRHRIACGLVAEIYLDWFISLGSYSGTYVDPFASDPIAEAVADVTQQLLKDNPMQFSPYPADTVSRDYTVFYRQCWSRVPTGDSTCPVQYMGCEAADCCYTNWDVSFNPTFDRRDAVFQNTGTQSCQSCCTEDSPPGGSGSCERVCDFIPN